MGERVVTINLPRVRRDQAIWRARLRGLTQKEIASAFGVTKARVARICLEVEKRVALALSRSGVYINDPYAYGIWHEFDFVRDDPKLIMRPADRFKRPPVFRS